MTDLFGLRWAASFLLYFFGGALVCFEVWSGFAFMQGERSYLQQAAHLPTFAALPVGPLAVAAATLSKQIKARKFTKFTVLRARARVATCSVLRRDLAVGHLAEARVDI